MIESFVATSTHLILVDNKKTFFTCEIGDWDFIHPVDTHAI